LAYHIIGIKSSSNRLAANDEGSRGLVGFTSQACRLSHMHSVQRKAYLRYQEFSFHLRKSIIASRLCGFYSTIGTRLLVRAGRPPTSSLNVRNKGKRQYFKSPPESFAEGKEPCKCVYVQPHARRTPPCPMYQSQVNLGSLAIWYTRTPCRQRTATRC
jgi:hypothetical protein